MTAAELKYYITEKGALPLVCAVEKLHLYLYGENFKVVVDHKSLKFIFSSGSKLNARIARWQIKLQAYDFDIIYINGEENIADFISRTCIPNEILNDSDENEVAAYVNFLVTKMAFKPISLEDIKTETAIDISLVAVKTAFLSGKWYDNPIFEPYCRFQNELTDHEGNYIKRKKNCFTKVSSKKSFKNCT